MHVVAEQDSVADGHHVTSNAVVRSGNAFRAQQRGVDGTEHQLASFVELIQP